MAKNETIRRVVIMGAAGRDFHNFNMVYRGDPQYEVVAFTAAQIPGIAERRYPSTLTGALYPQGIPVFPESALEKLIDDYEIDDIVFAYSDTPHTQVMHTASRVLATGADFVLLGPGHTMLEASKPVIAITAIRTGCGKSQTARHISGLVRNRGLHAAVLRHPMPYGDLERQAVQRLATMADLDAAQCTTEEREEYEPHIAVGNVVFTGIDYAEILKIAEREADIIIWDGGNNDFSFIRPDLHIVMADALRPGQATGYYPGEAVLRMADIIVLNKVDAASPSTADSIASELTAVNSTAPVVRAASPVTLDDPETVRGRKVLIVEDGPTITHGGQPYGAGYVAAQTHGVAGIVDPRDSAAPLIQETYARYPHMGPVLPAMGYSPEQTAALRATIEDSAADAVIIASPTDLGTELNLTKPFVRARYAYEDAGEPTLGALIEQWFDDLSGAN